jgi:iron-sulfur cluster repair protein YtfE (RIC family)
LITLDFLSLWSGRNHDSHEVTRSDHTPSASFDREWISRTLTELIAHIGERYRRENERRFDAVGLALAEARAPDGPLEAALTRLRDTFAALDEHVGAHTKVEFDLLFPTIIALEHPQVLEVRQPAALVERLASQVTQDHDRIRGLLDTLDSTIGPSLAHSLVQSPTLVMLIAHVMTLTLQLRQQLELEDRCLWPRASELLRQLA